MNWKTHKRLLQKKEQEYRQRLLHKENLLNNQIKEED